MPLRVPGSAVNSHCSVARSLYDRCESARRIVSLVEKERGREGEKILSKSRRRVINTWRVLNQCLTDFHRFSRSFPREESPWMLRKNDAYICAYSARKVRIFSFVFAISELPFVSKINWAVYFKNCNKNPPIKRVHWNTWYKEITYAHNLLKIFRSCLAGRDVNNVS